jgi:hypothetical protein
VQVGVAVVLAGFLAASVVALLGGIRMLRLRSLGVGAR